MKVPPASANLSTRARAVSGSAPYPQPVPKWAAPRTSSEVRRPVARPKVKWSMSGTRLSVSEFISQYSDGIGPVVQSQSLPAPDPQPMIGAQHPLLVGEHMEGLPQRDHRRIPPVAEPHRDVRAVVAERA